MAPELKLNQITIANQEDLKRADMWSIGMVMHVLMNPELGCPYRAEAEQSGVPNTEAVVKNLLAKGRLPQHGTKYEKLRMNSWWQLEEIFNVSANFDPAARPSASRVLSIFNNHLSESFQCKKLALSQSTVVKQYSRDAAAKIQVNSYQSACEEGHVPLLDDATNCCAFLSIGICNRLLNSDKSQNQQTWETVRKVVENVICQLPSCVNEHRDVSSFYDVQEAYAIMPSKNLLHQQYEFQKNVFRGTKCFRALEDMSLLKV
ncbi:Tyrosine- kinase SPK-1 [Paramuricea clavata]|uniref:Tyrosine- kinase SPK-1 n=1 Tax=Paramuricea clavata TaxID=317549 RepID=A0A7D9ICI7_PARCT|nr:Tyrosine- kinase SPK-1 [Paramuricea clavata]